MAGTFMRSCSRRDVSRSVSANQRDIEVIFVASLP